jgi:hypothetical protein
MLQGDDDAAERAATVAEWLADHRHFMTHGHPISRQTAEEKGLKSYIWKVTKRFKMLFFQYIMPLPILLRRRVL